MIYAYAKVNFILKVTGKTKNNYHNLQMVNAKIDLYDEITIEKKDTDELVFLNSSLNGAKDDLVLKCLKEIKAYYHINDSFKITIKKNIPQGSGLGGASADVGAVVKYILNMYNYKVKLKVLTKLLTKYGADIPYSLINDVAIVEKIGDKITKIKYRFDKPFLIVYPNIFLSTKDVFKNATTFTKKYTHKKILKALNKKGYEAFDNDLLPAACKTDERLSKIVASLEKIAPTKMSGSGSTMMMFSTNLEDTYNKVKSIYPNFYIRKVKVLENGKK